MENNVGVSTQRQAMAELLGMKGEQSDRKIEGFFKSVANYDYFALPGMHDDFEVDYRSKDNLTIPPLRLRLAPIKIDEKSDLQINVWCASNITTEAEKTAIEKVAADLTDILNIPCVSTARISKRQS